MVVQSVRGQHELCPASVSQTCLGQGRNVCASLFSPVRWGEHAHMFMLCSSFILFVMICKLHAAQQVWYEDVYYCEKGKGERERRYSLSEP